MEPIRAMGQWWLPERSDVKVTGTLTVSEEGRSELTLLGTLQDVRALMKHQKMPDGSTVSTYTDLDLREAGDYPIIVGEAGGRIYTLLDCFMTHSDGFPGMQISAETVHVNQVLQNAGFVAGEEILFDSIEIHITWMPYWVRASQLRESWVTSEEGGVGGVSLEVSTLPDEKADLPDSGLELRLRHSCSLSGDQVMERTLRQDAYFTLRSPTLVPMRDLLSIAGDLHGLVSVGLDKQVAFDSVSFGHPDLGRQIGDQFRRTEINFLVPWQTTLQDAAPAPRLHDALFGLPDIGGMDGVVQWITIISKYRPAFGRALAAFMNKCLFVSDRLMNTVAALEGYDTQKHGDEQKTSLKDRLVRIADRSAPAGQMLSVTSNYGQKS